MTTKLNLIKSALRESIEISSKSTEGPRAVCEHSWQESSVLSRVVGKTICCLSVEDNEETVDAESVIRDANAAFLANARTMTPLACKELLEIIELCEFVANEESLARRILKTITSEWPDV